jgi:glycosyltransferase involved in cell wall biosynthesis
MERLPLRVGERDTRGGFTVEAAPMSAADNADVFVVHDSPPDAVLARTCAPIVQVIHGRPASNFRPEQNQPGTYNMFGVLFERFGRPRVKRILTMWDLHEQFWTALGMGSKLVNLGTPPIDAERFVVDGYKYRFGEKSGRYNIVIADSWREDIDCFEVAVGVLRAAQEMPEAGIRLHIFAAENHRIGPWQHVFKALKAVDALGEVVERVPYLNDVYRGADLVVTPHRICTRVVGEAVCCGTPVLAHLGNEYAQVVTDTENPAQVASAIRHMMEVGKETFVDSLAEVRERFSLAEASKKLTAMYEEILS